MDNIKIKDPRKQFKSIALILSIVSLSGPFLYMLDTYFYYQYFLDIFYWIAPLLSILLSVAYSYEYIKVAGQKGVIENKPILITSLASVLYFVLYNYNKYSATLFMSIILLTTFIPINPYAQTFILFITPILSFFPLLQIIPIVLFIYLTTKGLKLSVSRIEFIVSTLLITQYLASNFLLYHKSFHLVNLYIVLLAVSSYLDLRKGKFLNKIKLIKSMNMLFLALYTETLLAILAIIIPIFDTVYDTFMLVLLLLALKLVKDM